MLNRNNDKPTSISLLSVILTEKNANIFLFSLPQCTALEAKLCQVESKYLVLLQEVKTPVCSSAAQNPAHEIISRLLEDALQAESPDQQEHLILKPNTVRYGLQEYTLCLY